MEIDRQKVNGNNEWLSFPIESNALGKWIWHNGLIYLINPKELDF